MRDEKQLFCLLNLFEKRGNYSDAWGIAAELASSAKFPPRHPIHARLIALEAKLAEQQCEPARPIQEAKPASTSACPPDPNP